MIRNRTTVSTRSNKETPKKGQFHDVVLEHPQRMKKKRHGFGLRVGNYLVCVLLFSLALSFSPIIAWISQSLSSSSSDSSTIHLSIVVLTYQKHESLAKLLSSIIVQESSVNFELLVVDNGCMTETKNFVTRLIQSNAERNSNEEYTSSPLRDIQYIPLCNNPGYAKGNNMGVKHASKQSKRLLFLNDDIILTTTNFIQSMFQLSESKTNARAVGCKLINKKGTKLIEAGSIVWNDGSAFPYGRKTLDIDAPEVSYPRPVDYISGACLMVHKTIFDDYGGFDSKTFPNYYEDSDLQMHIQHDLHKEVWYQPQSVAKHEEHGTFGGEKSKELMEKAKSIFVSKWERAINGTHFPPPFSSSPREMKKVMFQANDLRARNPDGVKILYLDDCIPLKSKGSGFGRSFDNLSMLANLGYKVTLITYLEVVDQDVHECQAIQELGIECMTESWDHIAISRSGYYDIVIVSRPDNLLRTMDTWYNIRKQHPFQLVYDMEALAYRRDEMRMNVFEERNIQFPSLITTEDEKGNREDTTRDTIQGLRNIEESLVGVADVIISVSDRESSFVGEMRPDVKDNVFTIGHIMDVDFDRITAKNFDSRNGILFIASFNNNMYYNGDAMWYFLKEVYPLIFKESSTASIPTLTIAGRGISPRLSDYIQGMDTELKKHITVRESISADAMQDLYDSTRIFIAPHLYGAGIQYKISEALSHGIPIVMSSFTADSFGIHSSSSSSSDVTPFGCVGDTEQSFTKCILKLHNSKSEWESSQRKGFDFLEQTHRRDTVEHRWSEVIEHALHQRSNAQETDKINTDSYEEIISMYKNSWIENVCDSMPAHVCKFMGVLKKRQVTFCSTEISGSTLHYFANISDGEFVLPKKYWFELNHLSKLDATSRQNLLKSSQWRHVLFVRHVLDRFLAEFFSKINKPCKNPNEDQKVLQHYEQHGFSCGDVEMSRLNRFVSFLETIPTKKLERNFAAQISKCNVKEFPYTDIIVSDENWNDKMKQLSAKLGVSHPVETISDGTKSKWKNVFQGKKKSILVERIFSLYQMDCSTVPEICDVKELIASGP